jgi:transposase-like protein
MSRSANASKLRRWLELVRLWQRSQLTVRAFCSRHRLSEPSFYAWRRVLRQRGLLQGGPSAPHPSESTSSKPAFVKLSLGASEPHTPAAVELVLSQRRLLRVYPGFDPDTLRQLVHLLEEPAC